MADSNNVQNNSGVQALWRIGIVVLAALVMTMVLSPWVYYLTRQITLFSLDEQPFRRVFDRVILVAVVAGVVLAWRWIGLTFNFKQLYRRKRAVSRYLLWMAIGIVCITILIYAQAAVGLRYGRDRSFSYMLNKTITALISAVAVGLLEESIFRGYVLQAFLQQISKYKAILLTSIIFAVLHVFSLDYFLKPIKTEAKRLDKDHYSCQVTVPGTFEVITRTSKDVYTNMVKYGYNAETGTWPDPAEKQNIEDGFTPPPKTVWVTNTGMMYVKIKGARTVTINGVEAKRDESVDPLAGIKLVGLFFLPLKEPLLVLPGLIGLFLAAWLLAELTVRTKSLWAAMGLHTGWVFAIKFWGRLWKFNSSPPPEAGSQWFFGDSYAATGVLGWLIVGFLILCVTGLVTYGIYRFVAAIAMLIPHWTALKYGRFIGRVMNVFAFRQKRIALDNIRHAFPEKTEQECRAIARQSFETLGMVFLEFLQFKKLQRIHSGFLIMTGEEHIEQARAEGKGIIYFTGHFCNWEMLALQCVVKNYPFSAIAREYRNKWIYQHIQKIRTHGGIAMLDKRESARDILRCIRNNEMVGFVADQYAGSKGLFIDFFGRPASTTPAMATLGRKTGAAIIPAFNHMSDDGHHETFLHPALHVTKTDNAEKDIYDTTQKLMKILEQEIRDRPGRYLWAHRKWRIRKQNNG